MTAHRPCPPALGPLEEYAARFDDLFGSLAQRRGFHEYLTGLLAPRDRSKTITCRAGAEPVVGAGGPAVQRSSSSCPKRPGTPTGSTVGGLSCCGCRRRPRRTAAGLIVIDDSGDRKDGTATAHVGRQRSDPGFRTKPQISAALAVRGKEAGFTCRAVVADCAYSTSDDWYLALRDAGLPYVVALRPHRGTWARADEPHTPIDAARALVGTDPDHPGDRQQVPAPRDRSARAGTAPTRPPRPPRPR